MLGHLGDEEFGHLEAIRLEELRLLAVEIETEAELLLGRFSECASRLRALVVEYPYRERFWRLLVRALFSDERRLEAMETYDEYARWMEQSGLEPDITFDQLVSGVASPAQNLGGPRRLWRRRVALATLAAASQLLCWAEPSRPRRSPAMPSSCVLARTAESSARSAQTHDAGH